MRASVRMVWALSLLAGVMAGCSAGPGTAEVSRQLAARTDFSRAGNEPLLEPRAVERFYKARSSRPAWTGHEDEIVAAIRGVAADGLDPADYHLEAIETLRAQKGAERTAANAARLEVLLADAVAAIADHVHYGKVRPAEVNPEWNADPRDDAPPLDSTLAVIASAGRIGPALDAQRPNHFIYRGLMSALASLRKIDAAGGWGSVRTGKSVKPDARDPRIPALRRRLAAEGSPTGAPADSTRYDAGLVDAVKLFQARHRIDNGGVLDAATVEALNVSVKERIAQVRVNLERARWVLGGLEGDFMLVNLPAFKAYLIRGNRNVWESRTQIGQEAMQTPTFRAKIRTIVFNPDWTVPPTILAKEILEDMRAGKNTIDRQGLVIYDASNNVVDPSSIDWASATPEDFPYTLRQPAGEDNALGKVKFLFPNKYSIYLHDTPSRHLFESDKRTFSHGCIRIENPLELAGQLLEGQWDETRIQEAVASDSTRNVALEHPMPILIVYWTVSVGASGEVRYTEDVYHLDSPLLAALDRTRRRA